MIGISQNSTFAFVWKKSVAPPVLSHTGYAFPILLIKNKLQLTLPIEKLIIYFLYRKYVQLLSYEEIINEYEAKKKEKYRGFWHLIIKVLRYFSVLKFVMVSFLIINILLMVSFCNII